jgi:hypothetical protein
VYGPPTGKKEAEKEPSSLGLTLLVTPVEVFLIVISADATFTFPLMEEVVPTSEKTGMAKSKEKTSR